MEDVLLGGSALLHFPQAMMEKLEKEADAYSEAEVRHERMVLLDLQQEGCRGRCRSQDRSLRRSGGPA